MHNTLGREDVLRSSLACGLEMSTERPESEPSKDRPKTASPSGGRFIWGLLAGVLIAAAVIALAVQNTNDATVSFLFWDGSAPLIVLITVAFLLGVLLTQIAGFIARTRRNRRLRQREELKSLRDQSG